MITDVDTGQIPSLELVLLLLLLLLLLFLLPWSAHLPLPCSAQDRTQVFHVLGDGSTISLQPHIPRPLRLKVYGTQRTLVYF